MCVLLMTNMQSVIIFCDIDGTIIPQPEIPHMRNNKELGKISLSKDIISQIKFLMNRWAFIFVTGRTPSTRKVTIDMLKSFDKSKYNIYFYDFDNTFDISKYSEFEFDIIAYYKFKLDIIKKYSKNYYHIVIIDDKIRLLNYIKKNLKTDALLFLIHGIYNETTKNMYVQELL